MLSDYVGGVSGERDLDGGEGIVALCGHGDQIAWDTAPCFGVELGAETPGHLEPGLCHADPALASVFGEAGVWVTHEAQDGVPVPDEAFMQVVRVGLRDPPAPSLGAWRDPGQFPEPMPGDGAIPRAHGPSEIPGQGPGGACVDPVTCQAEQCLHQAGPAHAVGVDDEGQLAKEMRAAQLVPAAGVGQVGLPAVMDQRAGVARDDADLLDGLPAAPAVQEPQGQISVARHMEPLGPAVDPQAGLVGMQGRGFQQRSAADILR